MSFLWSAVEKTASVSKLMVACTLGKYPSALVWDQPASIVYRTPLSATQLNARRTAGDGDLSYELARLISADESLVLQPGEHKITARVAGTATYSEATVERTITVTKRPVTFTWKPRREGFAVGEPFTAGRLNYTAVDGLDGTAVPGSVTFLVAEKGKDVKTSLDETTCLRAGKHVVTATFTPDDTQHYVCDRKDVVAEFDVPRAKPVVEFTGPPTIAFASASLPNSAVTAVATYRGQTVAGVCVITSPIDTYRLTPAKGPATRYPVKFIPEDIDQFAEVSQSLDIQVIKAVATATWDNPASIVYGTLLSATQLNVDCSVSPQKVAYSPGLQTKLDGGEHELTATVTLPADYDSLPPLKVKISVTPAPPVIAWVPSPTNPNTPLGATQLNATASFSWVNSSKQTVTEQVPGVFAYAPALGVATNAAAGVQVLTATFTPSNTKRYSVVHANATLTLKWATEEQIHAADLNDEMRAKVLGGKFKKDGSLVGAHGNSILGNPAYTCTYLGTNADGTRRYNVQKRKNDGSLSAAKFSTLPPATWDDDAFLYATVQASSAPGSPPNADKRTTHNMSVPHPATGVAVPWEVVKNEQGQIIASYPTG